jgi:hypothetical protein
MTGVGCADMCSGMRCTLNPVHREQTKLQYCTINAVTSLCATMSLSSHKETYDSYSPSVLSNRSSIYGVLHDVSARESVQSQEGSISNFSVHSTTDKDLYDLSGQGEFLPPVLHYSLNSSSGQDPSVSDYKYLSYQKPTSGFRNQCLSVCTTCEPESNRGSTATFAPSLLSLEDEAETAESSPPSTPHTSRAIASSPSPTPVYADPPLPSLGEGDSQTLAGIEIPTDDAPFTRLANFFSRPSTSPTDHVATLKPTPSLAKVHAASATRVRALQSFEPTKSDELAFEKGDIIKVVNREYKDWWGQLGGRTGKFPVNYVVRSRTTLYLCLYRCLHLGGIQEPLPGPSPAELAAEAQQEAAVFSQTAHVDRLLTMLSTLDPAKDNLDDNEEIQELYRSYMSLRPKIVKLIDEYSQKRGMFSLRTKHKVPTELTICFSAAHLEWMDESFVRARRLLDGEMEVSHSDCNGHLPFVSTNLYRPTRMK